jgi:hypothetical protein
MSQLYNPMLILLRASGLDHQTLNRVEQGLRRGNQSVILKLAVDLLHRLPQKLTLQDQIAIQGHKRTAGVVEYDVMRGLCGEVINNFRQKLGITPDEVKNLAKMDWQEVGQRTPVKPTILTPQALQR